MSVLLALALMAASGDEPKPKVDVAFLVDRSGSMSAVIETAKQKIWSIVNEIAKSKPAPVLRIGLIGYGSADQDIKLFPLSEDLDQIYANLLTFKTDMGGDEWVGWAIQQATQKFEWAAEKSALRVIFVVGNETAAQGNLEVLYPKTVPEAIKRDITVNAIYCGTPNPEEMKTWMEVAKLADGIYTTIDLSGGAITIETPFDQKMIELNEKLNKTYLAYGKEGQVAQMNQAAQDRNSSDNGGASNLAARAQAKCWSGYNCARWDLVDASKEKGFDWAKIKAEDLPEPMRKMSAEERVAHVAKMAQERESIQKEVGQNGIERQKYMDVEIKKRNLTQDSAFDEAVRRAVRTQGTRKGFTFEDSK